MKQLTIQQKSEAVIREITESGKTPTMFLHACCAPCSSYCLEYLSDYFDILHFYYNPNISPIKEYETRLEELRKLIEKQPHSHSVTLIEGKYDPERFFEVAKGLEEAPEGGERCRRCFELRLEEAARVAKEHNADFFTTTLTISPLKNTALLNEIGEKMGEKYGIRWFPSDFKKKGGYQRSIELSREYELYRQNYCGCIFSKMSAEAIRADASGKKEDCND